MKKYISIILSILCVLSLVGCGKKEKYEIEILVPAGSTEAFVYSDEVIRPTGNKITISAGAGLADTEVVLKPVGVKQENAYEPTYLTHGMPVKMDVEKGGWFKIGVSVQNDSDRGPIAVSVEVEGVEVRIAEKADTESSEEVAVGGDLIPMVMVEGELYLDTGYESTAEARCGVMDGEITSTVDAAEQPTKDNESNFGTGYGYQYGSQEGLIEIYMNDKWRLFATEKALASSQMLIEQETSDEIISYNGKEYLKSELCDATLQWLRLSEQERMLSSYMPPEFMIFEETWGITLSAENITSTSATIKCTQSGGNPTGELDTGSWYILENWTQENGWMEMPYIINGEIAWTQEAWIILMNNTCEWEINWEWLYGTVPNGKYRIGKEITDFRATGDYDKAVYFVEFEIE